jgi:cell division protein ZapE
VPDRLTDRTPQVGVERILGELSPPPRFGDVRFASYQPDPGEPSQAHALSRLERFALRLHERPARGGLFRRKPRAPHGAAGVYLDGGYGVGKTHLLASLWHASPGPKAYATFVEFTHLVGALGFNDAVEALSRHALVCIDEFELDDPGDTVLVSTLLGRLVDAGVRLGATSNTLPEKLGEGRFAAADFLREIQALSKRFDVVRIEGEDYRHRGLPTPPAPYDDTALVAALDGRSGATLDELSALCEHLASLHPSRYGALLDGVSAVGLRAVRPVDDQATALRLVVFVDRLYDREIPVLASGLPLDQVFPEEFLHGGYRKKYLRAVSRLVALSRDAHAG